MLLPTRRIHSLSHSLLIYWVSLTNPYRTAKNNPHPQLPPHLPSLTGTLSGYLLRILADSTHRCSEGETGKQTGGQRLQGWGQAWVGPLGSLLSCSHPRPIQRSIGEFKHCQSGSRMSGRYSIRDQVVVHLFLVQHVSRADTEHRQREKREVIGDKVQRIHLGSAHRTCSLAQITGLHLEGSL